MEHKLLLEFMRENSLADNLIYKKAAEQQMVFVRDTIGKLAKSPVFVFSTHTSKSCLLPVYGLMLDNGIKLIMRDNFYGLVVSIKSHVKISVPAILVYGDYDSDEIYPCYCEGFHESWCYKFETENFNYSTFRVNNDYNLYTLIYELNKVDNDILRNEDANMSESIVKMLAETEMSHRKEGIKLYDVFTSYNIVSDCDFEKTHGLKSNLNGDDIEEFAKRVAMDEKSKKRFNLDIQKLYWGENFL